MVAKLEALPDTKMISAAWRILIMHKLSPSWLDTVPSDVYSAAANKLSICLHMFVIQIASRPPPGPKIYFQTAAPAELDADGGLASVASQLGEESQGR